MNYLLAKQRMGEGEWEREREAEREWRWGSCGSDEKVGSNVSVQVDQWMRNKWISFRISKENWLQVSSTSWGLNNEKKTSVVVLVNSDVICLTIVYSYLRLQGSFSDNIAANENGSNAYPVPYTHSKAKRYVSEQQHRQLATVDTYTESSQGQLTK